MNALQFLARTIATRQAFWEARLYHRSVPNTPKNLLNYQQLVAWVVMFLNAYLYVDFALYSRPYHLHKILVLTYLQENNPIILLFSSLISLQKIACVGSWSIRS